MTIDDDREVVDEPRNPDPFILAAHVSAQQYTGPRMHVGTATDREIAAHVDGWAAARDHLAAQEPTDAEVEAAARALWAMRWATSWDEYSGGREPASPTGNDLRAVQMRRARAALSAARAVGRDAR